MFAAVSEVWQLLTGFPSGQAGETSRKKKRCPAAWSEPVDAAVDDRRDNCLAVNPKASQGTAAGGMSLSRSFVGFTLGCQARLRISDSQPGKAGHVWVAV
ncbi:MAG: hypothetical protein CBB71_04440 [Rhodopirellula sp. TMED11]|nr:MAG: hypothetical protein CBB71_04440 [Rhodopirellula sp. TMED11]